MSTTPSMLPGAEDPAWKWQLVERIIATGSFARAPQLREFLLFVARRALIDGRREVTESEIARMALGRGADFDPKEDNIVRVQAHQVRARLGDYFKNEGLQEPVILTIPKRNYLPQLVPRHAEAPPEANSENPGAAPPPQRLGFSIAWVMAALLLCAVAMCLLLSWRLDRVSAHAAKPLPSRAENALLERVFHPGQTTTIVVADSGLTLIQEVLHTPVSLDEYVQRDFEAKMAASGQSREVRALLRSALAGNRTSLAAAVVATELAQQSVRYGANIVVRSAKQLSIRELQTGDFIMVGGPRAVPWISLFENRLNFRIQGNTKTLEYWIENRSPAADEQRKYVAHLTSPLRETYATVSLLPGPGGKGNLLLLSGLDTEATEAAGRFLEHNDLPGEITDWLRQEGHAGELLLQSRSISNETWDVKLIAFRKIDLSEQPVLRLSKR
jgi:hypothetical protein